MQPNNFFCSNPACPSCGELDKGNIIWHHKSKGRLKCKECGKTFSRDKGTPFFGLRKTKDLLVIITTLIIHGCPLQAISKAFELDMRTVTALLERVGTHCEQLHEHLVHQPRDHGQSR